MTLLLRTEDLVAERRAVRVADIAAATQAALQQLERLQAVAAAIGNQAAGGHATTAEAGAAATADLVDTADIQQQLLAAAGTPHGGAAAVRGVGASPLPAPSDPAAASMLGPVKKLAEKERIIAQQYRAAARQAIQGMQEDVLRGLYRHDDLRPDAFLSRLRRILPSEYLAAWAAWTGIFALLDVSEDVMFAVWALYSVLAIGYMYLRLVRDRMAKDAIDAAPLPRDLPTGGGGATAAAAGGGGGGMRTVTVKADTLSMVASGVEAVSISRFSEKPDAADDALETASAEGSASDGMSTVDEEVGRGRRRFGARRVRGGAGARGTETRSRTAQRRTPGNVQLFLQALVSAVAFLLLSAFAAGIHTAIGAPVWVFFAPVAPFVLFAQFVLPDGLVSR